MLARVKMWLLRLEQHNAGLSKWTAKYRPWQLVRTSDRLHASDARKLENLLKKQKGSDGFYNITGLARTLKAGA